MFARSRFHRQYTAFRVLPCEHVQQAIEKGSHSNLLETDCCV